MQDFVSYLTRYPAEVTFGDEDPAAVFDRYHAEGFVLHNDGVRLDRDRLLAHVRPARKRATRVHVDVHEALVSGDTVAARYTLTAGLRGGAEVATEIYAFGRLAPDGRLLRLDQLTRTFEGSRGPAMA